eukprot:TRINITY_DN7638_c0_g1_i1.p1 TRINITY_DN7638_c0_g1~~TRINITY_DN7638_c0_g1_i1.p1  ORF type:complete len:419 (-),score=89.61 TRINITY_DN7638_c0_g1_i1:85-1341(-)
MAAWVDKMRKLWQSLARKGIVERDPRQVQLEADIDKLFLATSHNHLNNTTFKKDADEIHDPAMDKSFTDKLNGVQGNVHAQIKDICQAMDDILLVKQDKQDVVLNTELKSSKEKNKHRSGLSFAVGGIKAYAIAKRAVRGTTRNIGRMELSKSLKERIGYTLELKQSTIDHEEAGQGLFLDGKAGVGALIAFYPGLIYSPSYYKYMPGYPRLDAANFHLISRYDGIVIDAQPWGEGGEARELWDGTFESELATLTQTQNNGSKSDMLWQMLMKPHDKNMPSMVTAEVIERRNPLALGHYANHPGKGDQPNVMICPYDFLSSEREMRPYIPNLLVGNEDGTTMKRYGSFWISTGSRKYEHEEDPFSPIPFHPTIRTLVLVATREICDEEIFLNYRLSKPKSRPSWYHPVDEEEDKRRWS